jgi:hypothetical protein
VRADGVLQAIDTTLDDYRTVSSLPMSAGISNNTASAITFNPYDGITASNVQTAIEQVVDLKFRNAMVKVLTDASTTDVMEVLCSANSMRNMQLAYTVEAINTTTSTVRAKTGKLNMLVKSDDTTITSAILDPATLILDLGTAMTVVWASNDVAGKSTLRITATSGITPTSLKVYGNLITCDDSSVMPPSFL